MPSTVSISWFDRLLTQCRVRRISMMIAVIALVALVLSFAVSKDGRTPVGTTVAADFPQFYVAAEILSDPGPGRLYDLALQSRMQVRMFPGETRALPYAYPPIVAYVFRPLVHFSYTPAAEIFLVFVALFYFIGLAALFKTCTNIPVEKRRLGILVCLAFEPFAFECLHGGQVSTVAFACVCLGIMFDKAGRAILSGICVGLLAYKPTLLAILLPAMFVGRRWKMLAGCVGTIAAGGVASLCLAGPIACREFVRMIGTYGNAVAANDGFRTSKYVDLSAFLRMLHASGSVSFVVPIAGMIGMAIFLGGVQKREDSWSNRSMVWAAALVATLVFNLYVAIYDSVLIVPALWLMADKCWGEYGELTPGLKRLIAAVFLGPWVSPLVAMMLGFQIETVVLGGVLAWIVVSMRGIKSTDRELISVAPSPHP
jgi:glycosyl transferase family 87